MDEKVVTWKEMLAKGPIELPVREHWGMILDKQDRMIARGEPYMMELLATALNISVRYDKVRTYIRGGLTSQLFPFEAYSSPLAKAATEEEMLLMVDEHIDKLPDNWYADKPTRP
jgi:hypothetical protein